MSKTKTYWKGYSELGDVCDWRFASCRLSNLAAVENHPHGFVDDTS
jgi:hypothetical protein